MTTKQAPTLFGKRMRLDPDNETAIDCCTYYLVKLPVFDDCYVCETERGDWHANIPCRFNGPFRRTAQAAANDLGRELTRLHKALGKVIGDE